MPVIPSQSLPKSLIYLVNFKEIDIETLSAILELCPDYKRRGNDLYWHDNPESAKLKEILSDSTNIFYINY